MKAIIKGIMEELSQNKKTPASLHQKDFLISVKIQRHQNNV